MTQTLVIYHGGCRDGFCAAWVVNKFKNSYTEDNPNKVEYIPAYYGQEPPDCKDKDVIIVDFSYTSDKMLTILQQAKSLTWLDHHKTAESTAKLIEDNPQFAGIKFDFDLNRSGAGIAWDFFFQNEPRPWLVDYVEDRDLWRKKLQATEEINSYIACLEFSFDVWDWASKMSIEEATDNGVIAQLKTEQYVREVCKNVYFVNFDGNRKPTEAELNAILNDEPRHYDYENIPVVNIPQVDCSEVMDALLKLYPDSPFSLYWFRRPDGMYQYGMRSLRETHDFDVSSVAKLFGGGGHKNAAGFQLNYLLEELK